MKKCQNFINTAWKLSLFGVILVHIFPHLDWIRRVSLRIQSECGKLRTRKAPNMNIFYAVTKAKIFFLRKETEKSKFEAKENSEKSKRNKYQINDILKE